MLCTAFLDRADIRELMSVMGGSARAHNMEEGNVPRLGSLASEERNLTWFNRYSGALSKLHFGYWSSLVCCRVVVGMRASVASQMHAYSTP